LICCKSETNQLEVSYYPSKSAFKNEELLIPIDLDTTSLNFMDLIQMTPYIDYRKNVPAFEIKENDKIRRIVPFMPLFNKRTELMTITTDSIFVDKKHPIEDLEKVMKDIFGGPINSKFYNYKEWPHVARVAINIDTNSTGKELKKILVKTTSAFDKVKNSETDSLHLYIYFDFIRRVRVESKKNE